jgi:CheY-like chemotaxis protein
MPKRVLVADDNVDAATTLAMLVTQMGHEVRVCHDGQACLDLANAFMPHIIFLDIGMPGMNGFEVAERLRADIRHDGVRIVAVSGYAYGNDRRKSKLAGIDLHLAKPVDPGIIEELLAG